MANNKMSGILLLIVIMTGWKRTTKNTPDFTNAADKFIDY